MPASTAPPEREEFESAKARIAALCKDGKVSEEVDAVIGILFTLLTILITVLLEKTTAKTSANTGLPPSQTYKDESTRRGRTGGKGPAPSRQTGDNLRRTTVEEMVTVETCQACGANLSGVDPVARERRILYDIVFEVEERRVEAEVKECPDCQARTKGAFRDTMPGPLQYGSGMVRPACT